MISTLIGKIAGIFEKDFLFASLLPSLIFLAGVTTTFAAVIGFEATWAIAESWTLVQKAVLTTVATLGLVMFAYVLNAIRSGLISFWSGNSSVLGLMTGYRKLGEMRQKRRYRRMRNRSRRLSEWPDVLEGFSDEVRKKWNVALPPLPDAERRKLRKSLASLDEGRSADGVRKQLQPLVDAYVRWCGNDLNKFYYEVKTTLIDWGEYDAARIQTDTYMLDRHFGSLATIRATNLGNLIESYQQYPFKRYQIEAEIFWPRLQRVLPQEYERLVQEPKILLDFSLAMATLGAIYGIAAMVLGPWLWYDFWFWLAMAAAGLLVCVFFYRLSVRAAYEYGEMVRSSFDLFRLDLLAALGCQRPPRLRDEREEWERVSRLAVYGRDVDLAIRPEVAK